MKISLRYMSRENTFREKPERIGVCHTFGANDEKTEDGRRRKTIARIPSGKRYFDCRNCYPVCDPLIATTATLQELRDFHRPNCCQKCHSS